MTLWVTFVPSFLFVLTGAPYMERLRGSRALGAALATPLTRQMGKKKALIAVGIFAIVKSADRTAGPIIRVVGIVVLAIAVIDLICAIVVLGANAYSSGIGSLVVLGLIGALLTVGGARLARAE